MKAVNYLLARQLYECCWGKYRYARYAPLVNELLAEVGLGWFDGGCLVCADALLERVSEDNPGLSAGGTPPSLLTLAEQGQDVGHVVVSVAVQGHQLYLDANGISTEEDLLGYWQAEEGMRAPHLVAFDVQAYMRERYRRSPRTSRRLAEHLREALGPLEVSRFLVETDPRWVYVRRRRLPRSEPHDDAGVLLRQVLQVYRAEWVKLNKQEGGAEDQDEAYPVVTYLASFRPELEVQACSVQMAEALRRALGARPDLNIRVLW